ncbi:FecR domain-containing protein [Brucepastera parasyntrophica]|uniref:FecR family protein n=1 Tax=Brucepastera parasyntrophica TaxID=2880008 RepID=UPI00210DC207|nr:FecR family protein [Brucepastera parasyntrophica]ULQ60307.1 FecR domain-containing protein [Brucepastera parasyntrophica]
MKKIHKFCLLFTVLTLCTIPVWAEKANVVYVEGSAQIKTGAGVTKNAAIGHTVTYGESVITGRGGLVEMTLENGSTIRVTPNSVFNYSNTGSGADTQPVLAAAAGQIAFKLNRAAGNSPLIQTNSMVGGVRGTEFTIYAGRDGSVLLSVIEGIVDVTAQGKTVSLIKDEAVEVGAGQPPGEKFLWPGRELDFSDWNKGKTDGFIADPAGGLEKAAVMLKEYQTSLDALHAPYQDATEKWRQSAEEYKTLLAGGDDEAIKAFQQEKLFPAQDERADLILTIRYYALNYLSVRRYVLSNMYMEMKSRYPVNRPAEVEQFFTRHAELLAEYEEFIVPELNPNDY